MNATEKKWDANQEASKNKPAFAAGDGLTRPVQWGPAIPVMKSPHENRVSPRLNH